MIIQGESPYTTRLLYEDCVAFRYWHGDYLESYMMRQQDATKLTIDRIKYTKRGRLNKKRL